MGDSERTTRRKILSTLAAAGVALAVVAGFSSGLGSCAGPTTDARPRPLNQDEANRLASMRMHNHSDGRVGLRGIIGPPPKQTKISGWIDWQRPMVYLALEGPDPQSSVLVQAVPGVIAVRPGKVSAPDASPTPSLSASAAQPSIASSASPTAETTPAWTGPAQPPQHPPTDGWRVRPVAVEGEAKTPLDNLLAFLFVITRNAPDRADLLMRLKTEWVRRDSVAGTPVDVLLGPAVIPLSVPELEPSGAASGSAGGWEPAHLRSVSPAPEAAATTREAASAAPAAAATGPAAGPSAQPSASPSTSSSPADPTSLDAYGGAVGYWLDEQGRLHKLELVLDADLPATIEVVRSQRQPFAVIDALGGRDIDPKKVSKAEAALLSRMRQRNLTANGGRISITMPAMPGTLRTANGWLDWRNRLVYLSVRDLDQPERAALLHANRLGVSLRSAGSKPPKLPPLPPPRDGWETNTWEQLSGSGQATDLDYLLYEALLLAAPAADDVATVGKNARRLRLDILNGVPVGVFELPGPVDEGLPAGAARLRYWVDNGGVLRRLEIRTATGGLAQLDLDPSKQPPDLPSRTG